MQLTDRTGTGEGVTECEWKRRIYLSTCHTNPVLSANGIHHSLSVKMSPTLIATGIFGFQLSLTGAVVGFTPASSVLRPGILLLIASCPYFQFPYLEDIHYAPLRGALGAACIYTVIIYIDAVLLNKFTYEASGPISATGGLTPIKPNRSNTESKDFGTLKGALRRFQFGLNISTQGRFPATKWPVKNIPPFSRSEPDYVPGKGRFQLQTSLKVLVGFTLLALLGFAPKPGDGLTVFASEKVALLIRLDGVTKQEFTTRVGSVLGYWTVQYIIHVTVHGLLAVVAVTLGASEVKAWPPVFGSVQDAYSIRRYWGYVILRNEASLRRSTFMARIFANSFSETSTTNSFAGVVVVSRISQLIPSWVSKGVDLSVDTSS